MHPQSLPTPSGSVSVCVMLTLMLGVNGTGIILWTLLLALTLLVTLDLNTPSSEHCLFQGKGTFGEKKSCSFRKKLTKLWFAPLPTGKSRIYHYETRESCRISRMWRKPILQNLVHERLSCTDAFSLYSIWVGISTPGLWVNCFIATPKNLKKSLCACVDMEPS